MIFIKKTSSRDIIEAWQNFLKNQDLFSSTVDGLWGPKTEIATKQFQSNNVLSADGLIGSGTIKVAESFGFIIPKPEEFNPVGHTNTVCDFSHHIEKVNFTKAKEAGLVAVFHKATQASGQHLFTDKKYGERRIAAKQAGLLWGAYHFGVGGSGIDQANAFLEYTKPNNDTLLFLDFERCTTDGETDMSVEEAKDFVQQIKLKTGKFPLIYGGALLKEMMNKAVDPILTQCDLIIAQYSLKPHLPKGWDAYKFWQFTDGKVGYGALPIEGIGTCDRDLFKGTEAALRDYWQTHMV